MEIVIKIPEDAYDYLINTSFVKAPKIMFNQSAKDRKHKFFDIINAIKEGTPLPKGHGRLIDADKIQFENAEFDTYGDYSRAFDAIDQADTIIEADKGE